MNRNSEMIDRVHAVLERDRRLMIREVSEEVRVLIALCHAILTEGLGL
jgi:hypothetical protein